MSKVNIKEIDESCMDRDSYLQDRSKVGCIKKFKADFKNDLEKFMIMTNPDNKEYVECNSEDLIKIANSMISDLKILKDNIKDYMQYA